jgi:hypothetical protein
MQTTGPSVDGRPNFFEISGFGGLYNILIMNNLRLISSVRCGTKKKELFQENGLFREAGFISGCQTGCYRSVNSGGE